MGKIETSPKFIKRGDPNFPYLDRFFAKQTQTPIRVVGFESGGVMYLIATDRFDLTAEQVMLAYKLRWNIETFFG